MLFKLPNNSDYSKNIHDTKNINRNNYSDMNNNTSPNNNVNLININNNNNNIYLSFTIIFHNVHQDSWEKTTWLDIPQAKKLV